MPIVSFEPAIHEFSTDSGNTELSLLFRKFSALKHCVFLDGGGGNNRTSKLNRYSFLAADPIDRLVVSKTDPFDFCVLQQWIDRYSSIRVNGLPPFQGGLAGLVSYEFNTRLENIRPARIDEFDVPHLAFYLYDVVLAIDHQQKNSWLISQGWPAVDPQERNDQAQRRLQFFKDILLSEIPQQVETIFPASRIEPQSNMFRVDSDIELYSDFSKSEYLDTVAKAVNYIHAGDVFQVNLSQRLLTPAAARPQDLYLNMRNRNPAPFSGYLDFGTGQVISSSPERLVSINDSNIETRPIKGTRKRTHFPEVDLNTVAELVQSEKDRAENIMIVDLMRNDLSRISIPNSVIVEKLCGVEQFQNVLHLVSVVSAQLDPSLNQVDVLRCLFPGGSITGAPKIRAMEIIAELEPTVRGPYCGSLGYINFDGSMDFNILIRTITAKDGWWQISVGGGIVSDSKPDLELDETWTKAVGMLRAVVADSMNAGKSDPGSSCLAVQQL